MTSEHCYTGQPAHEQTIILFPSLTHCEVALGTKRAKLVFIANVTGTIKGTYYCTYSITKINQMYYAFQWLTSCLNDLICSELMCFPSFKREKGTCIWNVPRQSHIDLNCRDHAGHTADAFSGNPGWGLIYFRKCMTRRHQHYSIGKKYINGIAFWLEFCLHSLVIYKYIFAKKQQLKTKLKKKNFHQWKDWQSHREGIWNCTVAAVWISPEQTLPLRGS